MLLGPRGPLVSRRAFAAGLAATAACTASPSSSGGAPSSSLVVAAAMSLREVMAACERDFEAEHRGVDVVLNLAGSQTLAAQILEGAPVDVFLSADAAQMDRVVAAKLTGSSVAFAANRLVIIATPSSGVEAPADLTRPNLHLVLAGPSVPAGAYAREALGRLGIRDDALAGLVSDEENVRAVVHKVSLGEADAGIVYATDVAAAPSGSLRVIELPEAASIRALYYAAVLRASKEPALAEAFVASLMAPAAREALAAAGFSFP
ncbi:MAG: molybdate ABC transporter substrate-binding protein [Nannocystaceae bacterium]